MEAIIVANNMYSPVAGRIWKRFFDDCDREAYDYMVKQKLEKHISLTGSVDNVNEYLMASDIFVLPSDYEGFSWLCLRVSVCPALNCHEGQWATVSFRIMNGLLSIRR
jgi:glycosyltransferase involved in cell wall biosynthesis